MWSLYNTSELEHFIEQAKCIMNKGFFNLLGFESNVDCKNVDKHSGDTSVLGIIWNLDNDVLQCCADLELLTCEDHELPPNCKKEFLAWFKDTSVLKNVNISRHLKVNISSELHVFVDAAGGAYAACVFVRSIIDSKVNIVLVRAKSRVAPLKPLSIPRLELMACNVGVRLVNSLMKALNFPNLKITFWSDSTTALWWIKEQRNWSFFVSNRVKEIL
ncbi:integrase_H2C2 domain-containing protein [Trichonephila clavipes]|nr:integrase_H2C2 domain-containing protein [Trichonephila clavipes]